MSTSDDIVAGLFRAEWGRLLSLLVARTRRLALAEEALGEAFARAADRWRRDGVPAKPEAWLYQTAYRLVLDRLRADAVAAARVAAEKDFDCDEYELEQAMRSLAPADAASPWWEVIELAATFGAAGGGIAAVLMQEAAVAALVAALPLVAAGARNPVSIFLFAAVATAAAFVVFSLGFC